MIDPASTSVPAWARNPGEEGSPPGGGSGHIVVGVGSGQAVAQRWALQLTGVTMINSGQLDEASAQLTEHLGTSRVGVRVLLTGPIGVCLALRAAALAAGAEDDEIHVHATDSGPIDVHCAHCAASTPTLVGVDGLVGCSGCAKTLIVYHHVSRRLGKYLGFQVDAETVSEARA